MGEEKVRKKFLLSEKNFYKFEIILFGKFVTGRFVVARSISILIFSVFCFFGRSQVQFSIFWKITSSVVLFFQGSIVESERRVNNSLKNEH